MIADDKIIIVFLISLTLEQFCYAQGNVNIADKPISTTPGNNQIENAVFISPLSKYVIINSNNSAFPWYVSYFISINGGQSWTGEINGADPQNFADPSVVIDRSGRIIVGYIGYSCGSCFKISYTDNDGPPWTSITVPGSSNADKEHIWVDNNLNSIYEGRIYAAWNPYMTSKTDLLFTYSDDGGDNWLLTPVNISNTLLVQAGNVNQGINIQTGPQGNVYACWTAQDEPNGVVSQDNASICFNKSTNGGDAGTWLSNAQRIFDINGGYKAALGGGKGMDVFSWPSMAVNQQNSHIYIVWANYGVPGSDPAGEDVEIYMIKSENDGDTWSATPIRVNQDITNNDQWAPWISCDEISNALVVEYYDSRNFANNRAETYVSISYDDGNTWEDFRISDVDEDWSGNAYSNPGMDYIQVDVYHGLCIPVWSDNRASAGTDFRAYTNPFQVPCPDNLDLIYGDYDIYDQGDYTDYANQLYDGLYRTDGTINVAGSGSTYKVHAGAEVLMEAGEEIVLNDGFESDGEFVAIPNPACASFSEKWSGNEDENQNGNYGSYAESNSENPINRKDEVVKKKIVPSYRISPNPSNGKFIIILNNHPDSEISVNNPLGEAIYRSKIFHHKTEIDLSSNPPGLYFVKVITGEAVFIEKIVLK